MSANITTRQASSRAYHGSLASFHEPTGTHAEASRGVPFWLIEQEKAKAEALYCINPFDSIGQLFGQYGLLGKKWRTTAWRLTTWKNCRRGQIHGLNESFGIIVATDGIECVIYQSETKVYVGHVENWVDDETDMPEVVEKEKKVKVDRAMELLKELLC